MSAPVIYFFCREEENNLQEDVIALAEGLNELGVRHYANVNYWQQSPAPGDYLLRHDPLVTPGDCDLVVVSYTWPSWIDPKTYQVTRRPLPAGLFDAGRKYRTIYMDSHDGYRTVSWEREFRQFDVILRAKFNRRAWHPGNMRPWVLGLNNRILKATAGAAPAQARDKKILINFGASHPYPHSTRDAAASTFDAKIGRTLAIDRTKDDLSAEPGDPYDRLMWRQTGHRYSRSYYERLKATKAVSCFCGDLIPPAPFRPDQYLVGGNRAKIRRMLFEGLAAFDSRPRRATGWDSFRFWEALSAGCATFNIDLPYYGVELPVMPVNGEHYFGVRFDRVDETIDRVTADPQVIDRVADAGRRWALEHYSPRALAQRLLQC